MRLGLRAALVVGLLELPAAASAQRDGAAPIAPGMYEIRPMLSSQCLAYRNARLFVQDFLRTGPCTTGSFVSSFAILPHQGAYTLRLLPRRAAGTPEPTDTYCATVARGVVLGPPRIDVLRCETLASATHYLDAGAPDQIMSFRHVSSNVYTVEPSPGRCWQWRGEDVVQERCANNPNQRFQIRRIGGFEDYPVVARWLAERSVAAPAAVAVPVQPRPDLARPPQ